MKDTPSFLLSGDVLFFVFRHCFANWHGLTKAVSKLQILNAIPVANDAVAAIFFDGHDSRFCTPTNTHILPRVLIITLDFFSLISLGVLLIKARSTVTID